MIRTMHCLGFVLLFSGAGAWANGLSDCAGKVRLALVASEIDSSELSAQSKLALREKSPEQVESALGIESNQSLAIHYCVAAIGGLEHAPLIVGIDAAAVKSIMDLD